jgi:hypothetical protein
MLRPGAVRWGWALVASAGLVVSLAACQGPDEFFRGPAGEAGSGFTGAAGSIAGGTAGTGAGGAAGNIATGAAGSIATGAAGTSPTGAAGASAGGTGGGGASGMAGTIGAGGRGGATGAGGAAGRGGATGTGGRGGRGGVGGTTASGGRGGTTGTGGAAGRGGRGGSTGVAGTRGAGGASGTSGNACPAGGRLDCTSALSLATDGLVVDFSPGHWNAMTETWCDAHNLGGTLFSFAGTSSTAAAAVDATAQNLKLNLMVAAGQYAGGGVYFDSCVDATDFNSIQFTASITAGSLTNCTWQVQIQTQDQRPSTATNPSGGTCTAATRSRYPAATLAAATATATTFTTRFTSFNNPAASAIATPSQVVGLQWQVNSGNSGGGACTVELRIDNVKFVMQ